MDNPKTLAEMGTQYTGRSQTNKKNKENMKEKKTTLKLKDEQYRPHKNKTGGEAMH